MEAAPEFKNESQEKLALLATLQGKEIESLRPLRFLRRGEAQGHALRFFAVRYKATPYSISPVGCRSL